LEEIKKLLDLDFDPDGLIRSDSENKDS